MASDSSSGTAAGWGILRMDARREDGTLQVRLAGDLDIYSAG